MLKAALRDNGLRNVLRNVPPNSVLYYPGLDADNWHTGTIKDYSGKANNGTITGAITVRLSSGLRVLNFDGSDDYVNCGNNATLQITNNLTVMGWFKTPATFTTGTDAFGTNECIIGKYTSTGNQRGWNIGLINSGISGLTDKFCVTLGDPVDGTLEYVGYYNSSLVAATWYQYATTFASGALVAYLGTVATSPSVVTMTAQTGAVPATLWNSTGSVVLGAINAGVAQLWKGQEALTTIAGTTVLTAAQILTWHQQTRRYFI